MNEKLVAPLLAISAGLFAGSVGAQSTATPMADESLLQRADAIEPFEPPAALPLPESLFERPPSAKANARTGRSPGQMRQSFRCPDQSSSMITVVSVRAPSFTVVIGPQGDEVRFKAPQQGRDQLVRKSMRHGEVLFCVRAARAGEAVQPTLRLP